MRRLLCASLALVAGCTVSVPAPPEQRADLPDCGTAGQVATSGQSSSQLTCADQSALRVPRADHVAQADYATHANTASQAKRAGHVALADATTSNATVLVNTSTGPAPQSGPGLQVNGDAMVDSYNVPFFVGSFDSLPADGSTTALAAVGLATQVQLKTTAFSLPFREAVGTLPGNTYVVTISASGALSADGDPNKNDFTRCQVALSITNTAVPTQTPLTLTTFVTGYGLGLSPEGETPWMVRAHIALQAGSYAVGVQLSEAGSSVASPRCRTNGQPGEETHIEIEAM